MALIPPHFLDAVVSIGVNTENGKHWIGTGFLIGRPIMENSIKNYNTFLITNKHVLASHDNILLRFNHSSGVATQDHPVALVKEGKSVVSHHNDPDIDVAVFFINPNILNQAGSKFAFIPLDEQSLDVSGLKEEGVSEGDSIFVLGFPMSLVGESSNCVIARSGSIARMRGIIAQQRKDFMIDANVFPGNSGGPVINRPEFVAIEGTKAIQRSVLIGVVKSYLPYFDTAISQQTGRAKISFEENSGLALVETVDSIRETVEICYESYVLPGVEAEKKQPDNN